ncbi:GTP cyclohydrolase I [Kitasatospora sp. NPDC096147]|uniref:GTP cyclohydrolase I n=1 Tax=Kitasatospora sp. NPDC096147 TaxID=3364093 RepID=UPI003817448E
MVRKPVDTERVQQLYRELLIALGENPDREGLADTPRRAAAWWTEFLNHDPGTLDTTFANDNSHDGLVVLRGIDAWSLCEHHLLPFRLTVTIAYIPGTRVLGLSKLVRQLHAHTHALQVQERITTDLAHALAKAAGTDDVAVLAEGEHLCMSMRGVKAPEVRTLTSCRLGRTADDPTVTTLFGRLALPSPR